MLPSAISEAGAVRSLRAKNLRRIVVVFRKVIHFREISMQTLLCRDDSSILAIQQQVDRKKWAKDLLLDASSDLSFFHLTSIYHSTSIATYYPLQGE